MNRLFPDYRSPCNEIRGSDGMHFGTKIFHKNTIEIFNSQACRALRFKRDPNPSNVSDIQTIRYDLDVHQIDMRIKNNRCFCLQNSNISNVKTFGTENESKTTFSLNLYTQKGRRKKIP